jgi:hypothetical protein
MSLIETWLERPANLCIASRYTAMNGIVYLSAGAAHLVAGCRTGNFQRSNFRRRRTRGAFVH